MYIWVVKNAASVFERAIMKSLGEFEYTYLVYFYDTRVVEAFERLQIIRNKFSYMLGFDLIFQNVFS